ncbi:MAG: hypothetical protein ACM3MH_09790 [Actinomycetota bacterium]
MSIRVALPLMSLLVMSSFAARAEELPTEVGACSETTITDIGYRLGDPDSGSAISYANGGVQVSYDTIPEINHSEIGDPVKLCLVGVPEDCPPGDDRGKVYSATNLRTGESWEAPDSQHSCGGA